MSRLAIVCQSHGHYYGMANKKHRCTRCGFQKDGLASQLVLVPNVQPEARQRVSTPLSASVYLRPVGWSRELLGRDRA